MFDLSSSQHTFDSFTFHGIKTSTGVSIEICANDFSNVDLIVIEKYDQLETKLGGKGASQKTAKLIVADLK